MKKYGTGQILPEPDDAPAKPLSDDEREALRNENGTDGDAK